MKLSEQRIKDILKESREDYSNDPKLEEDILFTIDHLKGHESLLEQSKKRARIGMRVCFSLVALLIISIFYPLIIMKAKSPSTPDMFSPTYIVLIILTILFILMHGSRGLSAGVDK